MTAVPPQRSPVGELPAPDPLPGPHLADTTVWSKARVHSPLADWFNGEVRAGRILTCDVVVLELLRSARNTAAFEEQSTLLSALGHCPSGANQFARARAVQHLLATRGQHRGIPPADLLIAASAEAAGVGLLHYDHDYDVIAAESGQAARWFVPAGSLP